MSTRKLILLALACGLAILVAGGIQLLRISDGTPSLLQVGDSVEISSVTAQVLSGSVTGSEVRVEVRLRLAATAGAAITEPLVGWSLLTGGLTEPVPAGPAPGAAPASCSDVRLEPGGEVDCVLAFPVVPEDAGTTLVTYRVIGEQVTWDLGV